MMIELQTLKRVVYVLVVLNLLFLVYIAFNYESRLDEEPSLHSMTLTNIEDLPPIEIDESTEILQFNQHEKSHKYHKTWIESFHEIEEEKMSMNDFSKLFEKHDVFKTLGAYPPMSPFYLNTYADGKTHYFSPMYGVTHDENYCKETDLFMLNHPENLFNYSNFFTDYSPNGIFRRDVVEVLGYDTMPQVSRYIDGTLFNSETWHLDRSVNMFFTKRVDMHLQFEIGKEFQCTT
jgi:hypothetical protein